MASFYAVASVLKNLCGNFSKLDQYKKVFLDSCNNVFAWQDFGVCLYLEIPTYLLCFVQH